MDFIKKYPGLIVFTGIVIILIIWIAIGYNGMLSKEMEVDNAWGNVESQYQRRKDLIPNLEKTVKSYAKYEGETYLKVTKARTAAEEAQNIADATSTTVPGDEMELQRYVDAQDNAKKALDIYVNAVREAYPELQASKNYLEFQAQLEGTENRIQTARQEYNEKVKIYNTSVRSFPNVIVSGMLGFDKKSMFKADAGAQNAPSVFDDEE